MRVGGGESWWGAGGGEWEGVGTVEEDGAHGQGRGRGEVEGGRADGERRTARVLETSDFPGVCCQVLPGAARCCLWTTVSPQCPAYRTGYHARGYDRATTRR